MKQAAIRRRKPAVIPLEPARRTPDDEPQKGSSLAKMLRVLDIFTIDAPIWTIEAIAERLAYPQSSTYRYVRELCASGLLAGAGGGRYVVGSKIIELDHQIQSCDPVLRAVRELAPGLLKRVKTGAVTISGLRGNRVISMFALKKPETLDIGVERGRPMEMFRGAGAKTILAYLPTRKLMRVYLDRQPEIARVGMGDTWKEFSKNVAALRQRPFIVTRGEVDSRLCAMSTPIFDGDRRVIASLGFILPVEAAEPAALECMVAPLLDVATSINARMSGLASVAAPGGDAVRTSDGRA